MPSAADKQLLRPGISIGHPNAKGGTLGAIVFDRDTGEPCALSNWHVLMGPFGQLGTGIIQPAAQDGGMPSDRVASVLRGYIGIFGDAALGLIDKSQPLAHECFHTGTVITKAAEPQVGQVLEKAGRGSGVTRAKVEPLTTLPTDYLPSMIVYKLVPLTPGAPVSLPGDSGAIWYDPTTPTKDRTGCCLHVAGSPAGTEYALAPSLATLMTKLNASFT